MNPVARFIFRVFDRFERECDDFRVERSKRMMAACGERVFLSPRAVIWPECGLRVGDDVYIHSYAHIFASGGVTIGSGSMISALCSISSSTHPKEPERRHEQIHKPVVLGRNVWMGTGAIILPGVTIGDDAIIGAGAVVTKDVPAAAVYVGNPARALEARASSAI